MDDAAAVAIAEKRKQQPPREPSEREKAPFCVDDQERMRKREGGKPHPRSLPSLSLSLSFPSIIEAGSRSRSWGREIASKIMNKDIMAANANYETICY